MIKIADQNTLEKFADDNVYMTKILANIDTFGNSIDLLTWTMDSSAVIQKYGDSGIIYISKPLKNVDIHELSAFLKVVGFCTIFTDKATAKLLGKYRINGIIMQKLIVTHTTSPPKKHFISPAFPEYSKIYELLSECGFNLPKKDDFIADFSARIRKNTAHLICTTDYSAVCFTGYESAKCAVISAVAVHPKRWRQNMGSEILQAMCHSLCNRQIFLYRENNKNEDFYKHNGFENLEEYIELNLQ